MRWMYVGLILLALASPLRAAAQAESSIRISAPASGAVLRGAVEVTGSSAVDGFFVAEISFAYTTDLSTWFLIRTSDQPVTEGLLATWDTSTITDGDYVLRLHVTTQNFAVQETFVTGLQIRNQTPVETATLAPTETLSAFSTSAPQLTQTERPPVPVLPSPTSLAPNPAMVTQSEIINSLQRGLVMALISFLIIGLLFRIRRN